MFNVGEIKEWETKIDSSKINEFYGHVKVYYNPHFDRVRKWRRRCKLSFKDRKPMRKRHQVEFRAKMKTLLIREIYHNPVPHEYKTYGWMTW